MRPITQSRMRRRRWLPAAFCLLCCLLFSGCTPGATVDSLLKPPSLSEEQQQIYLALQDAVGSGITCSIPEPEPICLPYGSRSGQRRRGRSWCSIERPALPPWKMACGSASY
ncbi:MAG: hypothetical protein ACLR5S_11850 [Ruminococcus sp.]